MSQESIGQCFLVESSSLLDQSMAKIQHCVDQLSLEQIWWRPHETMNSIGNLILHMAGNLRQWTVVGIAQKPDDRDRQGEFAHRDPLSAEQLLEKLNHAVNEAKQLFSSLTADQLVESRRIQDFDVPVLGAISHTTSHFVGHTHQIIYITRLALGEQYIFHWSPESKRGDVPI